MKKKTASPIHVFPCEPNYTFLIPLSSYTILILYILIPYNLIPFSSHIIFLKSKFACFYIVLSHYPIFPTEILNLYFSLIFLHHNFLDLSCLFN